MDKYLSLCEQLGQEPNPDEMPIDPSLDFDVIAQQAFFLYHTLPDKVEGMAGLWLGKEFGGLLDIMNIYSIEHKREVMDYLLYMIQIARDCYSQERDNQSKMRK